MNRNQIAGRWRTNLVGKLQDRYGLSLSEEEVSKKVQAWLDWLQAQPGTQVCGKSLTPATKLRLSAAAKS